MSYIEKNLLPGEEIVYKASLHWAIFLPAIGWGFLGLIFTGGDLAKTELSFFFFLLAFLCLIIALAKKYTSEYVITNKRLILKTGIIGRSTVELMLTKCEGVAINQPLLGSILGYGTIVATTGGASNSFRKIKDPSKFRTCLHSEIDKAQKA